MKKLRDYFKLFRKPTSNKYEEFPPETSTSLQDLEISASSPKRRAGTNQYMPHQGKQERARRVRQQAAIAAKQQRSQSELRSK